MHSLVTPTLTGRLALVAVTAFAICTTAKGQAQIDPAALAFAKSVSAKLGAAQTIKLTAKHELDPALGVGGKLDKGPLHITVQRPNQFHAVQPAGHETREIAYDGKTFCLMQPELKIHALESFTAATIAQLADEVDRRFGFRPPVAELLASDLSAQLFMHVTSAKVTGTEWVGLRRCERLHIEQEGMTGDLWVGVKDRLPRRLLLTFTGLKGQPQWDIRMSKWELNAPVDQSLFSKRPASDSHRTKLLKSH